MQGGSNNYRVVAADMGIASGGAISLFVNQDSGNDRYDGLGRGSPKKTINGALSAAYPWADIFVDAGTYAENVIITNSHTRLLCEARSGSNAVIISPASGKAIVVNGNSCVIEGASIRPGDTTGIEVNNVDVKLDHLHISSVGEAFGIDLKGADRADINDVYVDCQGAQNSMGVLFNADTNDAVLRNSFITSCGSGIGEPVLNGYGIAFAEGAQDCVVKESVITDCRNGIYFYKGATPTRYKGHAVYRNHFSSNSLWDIYDPNGKYFQIDIEENYFAYDGWTDDDDHDGFADLSIPCGVNYDYKPLANKRSWMVRSGARRVA